MKPDLPEIIATYFANDNAGNPAALAACFAKDATVLDEGPTHQGSAAIARWMAEAKAKYQHTATPLAVEVQGGRTVVTATVAGNFPGSPIDLAHAFRLKGGRIVSLEIG
jgi:hypothetical protein